MQLQLQGHGMLNRKLTCDFKEDIDRNRNRDIIKVDSPKENFIVISTYSTRNGHNRGATVVGW